MKSFDQLGFKEGDKVRCLSTSSSNLYGLGEVYTLKRNTLGWLIGRPFDFDRRGWIDGSRGTWELVVDKPKNLVDMSDAEAGALLLAYHRGEELEYLDFGNNKVDRWYSKSKGCGLNNYRAYRLKPKEPVVVTYEFSGNANNEYEVWRSGLHRQDNYRFAYEVKDGKVDCSSIRMREIKEEHRE